MSMIRAYRREDGRYRLEQEDGVLTAIGLGAARDDLDWARYVEAGEVIVREEALAHVEAARMFGVITGPSSCGCEPAMFRWVGEKEVEAGRTRARHCATCPGGESIMDEDGDILGFTEEVTHECDIVEVCGEGEEALAVYEAQFRRSIEALT